MTSFYSPLTPSALGKRKRLQRIFGDKGKCVFLPLDDNLITLENMDLMTTPQLLSIAGRSEIGAYMACGGTASLIQSGEKPVILNVSASIDECCYSHKILISSVEQAVAMDAAAVLMHINISDPRVNDMMQNAGRLAQQSQNCGMPLFLTAYPRKELPDGTNYSYLDLRDTDEAAFTKYVSHCVRIAFELGADVIKTQYTGSEQSMRTVVAAASGRPLLAALGGFTTPDSLYPAVESCAKAGASGVALGRALFYRPDALEIVANVRKIMEECGV